MKSPTEQRPVVQEVIHTLCRHTKHNEQDNPSYVKVGICVSTGKRDAFILLMRMRQTQRKLVFVTILSTLLITVSKRKQVKNIFYN